MPLPPTHPGKPPVTEPLARINMRLAALEQRIRNLEALFNGGSSQTPAPTVQSLPVAGRAGRLLVLATDGKLYRDNGSSWVAIG